MILRKGYAAVPYQSIEDPLQRLLGYLDFRAAILRGELPEFTCLVGTMVQAVYETQPRIRDAGNRSISNHAAAVRAARRPGYPRWTVTAARPRFIDLSERLVKRWAPTPGAP